MPEFPVGEAKRAELVRRFADLGLKESDLEERFIRSSGPGGQHVNKTSTCVVLRHRPSGLEVRVQRERSQALNRFLARRLLADKLEALVRGRESALEQAREKVRRQKRRRSRRSQQRRLEEKRRQGLKKRLRTVGPDEG